MSEERTAHRRWLLGLITAAAWGFGFVIMVRNPYDGQLAALMIIVGWVLNAIYVGLDSHDRRMRAFWWTLLAALAGPLASLIYLTVRPAAPAACPNCGGRLRSRTEDCPSCGYRQPLGQFVGQATSLANRIVSGLGDSLTSGPVDRARHTSKHMAIALGALAAFSYILILGRYHGPGHGFMSFLWVVSVAAYWVLLPWWVYLDATWRRMDAIPWAILTLVTNIFGLVTYLVIRYPDPRTCPQCHAYLTVGLKRCPYCGSEAEPTCPRCQAPVKTDWVYCPACAAQLPAPGTSETKAAPSSLTISGSVMDAVTGRPVANAEVGTDSRADRLCTRTDSVGRYSLTDLQVRPHVIMAAAEGYASEAKAFTPGDAGQLHFTLHPAMRPAETTEKAGQAS